MNETTILSRADSVTFEVVADEAILIDMNSGTYFSLNTVGTVFWQQIDGKKSIGTIAQEIAEIFNGKARQFGVTLQKMAQSDQGGPNQIEELADEYDMDEAFVTECLATLKADSSDAGLNSLVADLSVEAGMVVGDLLELAGTMAKDALVTGA